MKKGLVFMGMGFELVGLILGCLYLGQELDKQMLWPGYSVATLVIFGLISWMVHLIYLLRRFMEDGGPDSDKAS